MNQHSLFRIVQALALGLALIPSPALGQAAAPNAPAPADASSGGAGPVDDYIVDNESPTCALGGPIVRITGGKPSTVAKGSPLQKPRGSAVDADGTLVVADAIAGLLRVDLASGAVRTIAAAPPYQPRDVVIDADGDYLVVDWPAAAQLFKAPLPPPSLLKVTPAGQVSTIVQGAPLVGPHGVALDDAGNVLIADDVTGLIRVAPDGSAAVLLALATPASGRPADPSKVLPRNVHSFTDVRVDANGDYVVADLIGGALWDVRGDGSFSAIHQGPPFSSGARGTAATAGADVVGGPRGVVVDRDGSYVVVDMKSNSLLRVSRQGDVSVIFSGDPLCGPSDVTLPQPIAPGAAHVG